MRRAGFLVDAGRRTGLGHLKRSEVLLRELQITGFECNLYCQEPLIARDTGLIAQRLPDSAFDFPYCDIIVCDSYLIDAERLAAYRKRCRILLVFDDLGNKPLAADIVLNHNLYGASVDYSHVSNSIILAGPQYTLVRAEVIEAAREFKSSRPSNNVVVSFGGTDDGSQAGPVAETLLRSPASIINIIVAPGITPSDEVGLLEERQPSRIRVHVGPNLPRLLADSRVYVGAAGMTATESHIIGLDMVLCIIADNQRLNARMLAGFGHEVFEGVNEDKIMQAVVRILNRPLTRRRVDVDGRGAERVTQVILRLLDGWS